MPIPTIQVYSADRSVQTINADNPLPVQVVAESAVADVTLAHISGTTAAAGATQLVAAPGAGLQIVVSTFVIQNESAVATTMRLQEGAVPRWRVLAQSQGSGLAGHFVIGREWVLPADTALNLWLSGANSCNYSVSYYVK